MILPIISRIRHVVVYEDTRLHLAATHKTSHHLGVRYRRRRMAQQHRRSYTSFLVSGYESRASQLAAKQHWQRCNCWVAHTHETESSMGGSSHMRPGGSSQVTPSRLKNGQQVRARVTDDG